MARAKTQFDDLLGATRPALNQTSTVKDLRDQRVSRTGQMLPLKILNLHAKRKFPGTPYLKAIIVNCYAYCPTCPGIIPMTERIDQSASRNAIGGK